jgi:hypothetical protein
VPSTKDRRVLRKKEILILVNLNRCAKRAR